MELMFRWSRLSPVLHYKMLVVEGQDHCEEEVNSHCCQTDGKSKVFKFWFLPVSRRPPPMYLCKWLMFWK